MHDRWTLPYITAADALAAHREGRHHLDLRRAPARRRSDRWVADTRWIDPETLDHSHPLTRSEDPLSIFCVAGHEVSHFACALLMMHGRDVRLVIGGFDALAVAGAALVALDLDGGDGDRT
ncbi:MAG: hypothetical protein AAF577_06155 [Pseudomonadota bacterium]